MGELSAEDRLQADVAEIMADKDWGRDPRLEAKVDAMYKRHCGTGKVRVDTGLVIEHGGNLNAPVPKPPGLKEPPSEPEASKLDPAEFGPDAEKWREKILEPLRQEWGPQFETHYAGAQEAARALFSDNPEGFVNLGRRLREIGPTAEVAGLRFLAELAKIRKGG